MNVLVVEPDRMAAKVYRSYFEELGWSVSIAHSGQIAMDCLDESQIDVILLELGLGQHNGIEFLYEFRSYPEWREVPVIVHSDMQLSAYTDDLSVFKLLGVQDFLYKPTTKLVHIARAIARHTRPHVV